MKLLTLKALLQTAKEIADTKQYDSIVLVNTGSSYEFHAAIVNYHHMGGDDYCNMEVDVYNAPTSYEIPEELYEGTYETPMVATPWCEYNVLMELPLDEEWASTLM